jgi:hypothetical protein
MAAASTELMFINVPPTSVFWMRIKRIIFDSFSVIKFLHNSAKIAVRFAFFLTREQWLPSCSLTADRVHRENPKCSFVIVSPPYRVGIPSPLHQICVANGINGVQFISIIKMPYHAPLETPRSHTKCGVMNGVFCLLTSVCQELSWYRNIHFYEFSQGT